MTMLLGAYLNHNTENQSKIVPGKLLLPYEIYYVEQDENSVLNSEFNSEVYR